MTDEEQIDISIIVPIYNVERYLRGCLESLIAQTKEDIEIICVNDCSTDYSLKILEEYANREGRIVVLTNEKNVGGGATRNRGVAQARGKWVGFVDSDDVVDKGYFEALYKLAISSGAEMVGAPMIDHYPDGKTNPGWWRVAKTDLHKEYSELGEKLELLYRNCNTSPCIHLYSAEFLRKYNITFPEGVLAEDQYFNFLALYYTNKIAFLPCDGPAYHYYTWTGMCAEPKEEDPSYRKKIQDQNTICEMILRFATVHSLQTQPFLVLLTDLVEISRGRMNKLQGKILVCYFERFREILLKYVPKEMVERLWTFPTIRFDRTYTKFDYWRYTVLSKLLWGQRRKKYENKRQLASRYLKFSKLVVHTTPVPTGPSPE